MNSKFLAAVPLLSLGSAGVFAGYKTYRLVWPQKWFEPKLDWGDKLTFIQHQEKMNEFKKKISNEQIESTIYLKDVPMPGNHMVWAHQSDSDFWKQRSEALKKMHDQGLSKHIPYETNKLKSWCSLHLNTRVHVKVSEKNEFQFRISKDDHVFVSSLASVGDLADVRNNCARLATNKEVFEKQLKQEEKGKESLSENCKKWAQQSYGTNLSEFKQQCLKTKDEETGNVISVLITYISKLFA